MTNDSTSKKHHRGGRPYASDPRKISITGKFTRAEFQQVMEKISASGLTRAAAVRMLLLHERLPQTVYGGIDITASQVYAELAPLQSNLNQIAGWLNKTRPTEIPRETIKSIHQNVQTTYALVQKLRAEILTAKPEMA